MLHTTTRTRSSSLALGAVGVLALSALLAGCGGGGSSASSASQDRIASLSSAPASGSKASSPAASTDESTHGRPVIRLDNYEADMTRYWNVYNQCLKDHGHKMLLQRGARSVDQSDKSPTAQAAKKDCAGKMPPQPPEMRRETNPHYAEDFKNEIKCINDGGLSVTALPNQEGWTYDGQPTMSDEQQSALMAKCQLQAYSRKK